MERISEVITAVLSDEGWAWRVDDEGTIHTGVQGAHGRWACHARVNEDERQAVFYSVAPIAAEPAQLQATAELVARANEGMVLGNFELHWDTGGVLYKTSIDVEGGALAPAMARALLLSNVSTVDRYRPALYAVLRHGARPADAVREVEADEAGHDPEPGGDDGDPGASPRLDEST